MDYFSNLLIFGVIFLINLKMGSEYKKPKEEGEVSEAEEQRAT